MAIDTDPTALDVERLFHTPSMFDSRSAWIAAGFDVFDRHDDDADKTMVARHPLVDGLLFKKYSRSVSLSDQLTNYAARVEGANRLRALVQTHALRHVVVPKKRIIELPRRFDVESHPAHVLVVDRIAIRKVKSSIAAYGRIDPAVLKELCFVLFHFRGLDSIVDNVPFTASGQLTFIDTENWSRGSRRPYLRHLRDHLSSDGRRRARKFFRKLEADRSAAVEGTFFDEEEETSSSEWPEPIGRRG